MADTTMSESLADRYDEIFGNIENGTFYSAYDRDTAALGTLREVSVALRISQDELVPTHRHKKRGTEYVLIGIGKMQAENWESVEFSPSLNCNVGLTVDMEEVAIYRSATDPTEIWVRPREEFEDGRFETLPTLTHPAPPLAVADELIAKALKEALYLAVAVVAFIGRDKGTERLESTIDSLCVVAGRVDPIVREAIVTLGATTSKTEVVRNVVTDEREGVFERRYNAFCDWYLRGGQRREVFEHGHVLTTTRQHIDDWADRAAALETE